MQLMDKLKARRIINILLVADIFVYIYAIVRFLVFSSFDKSNNSAYVSVLFASGATIALIALIIAKLVTSRNQAVASVGKKTVIILGVIPLFVGVVMFLMAVAFVIMLITGSNSNLLNGIN